MSAIHVDSIVYILLLNATLASEVQLRFTNLAGSLHVTDKERKEKMPLDS